MSAYSLNDVLVQLRKQQPMLFAFLQQLPKPIEGEGTCHVDLRGRISMDIPLLDGEPPEQYNLKPNGYGLSALVFILVHELCHVINSHVVMKANPLLSTSYSAMQRENPKKLARAVEYQCNALAVEALGYKFSDVVTPADPKSPVWMWDDSIDMKGKSLREIYDAMPDNSDMDDTVDNDIVTTISAGDGSGDDDSYDAIGKPLTENDVTNMLRRAMAYDRMGSNLAGSSLGKMILARVAPDEAKPLPWKQLLRRVTESTMTKAPSWARLNRKGSAAHPVKGTKAKSVGFRALVYVDTSCSVEETMIDAVVYALAKTPNVAVDLLWFDDGIHGVEGLDGKPTPIAIDPTTAKVAKIQGRGGTDFDGVADDWRTRKGYDLGICVTDGCASLPRGGQLHKFAWVKFGNEAFTPLEKVYALEG